MSKFSLSLSLSTDSSSKIISSTNFKAIFYTNSIIYDVVRYQESDVKYSYTRRVVKLLLDYTDRCKSPHADRRCAEIRLYVCSTILIGRGARAIF